MVCAQPGISKGMEIQYREALMVDLGDGLEDRLKRRLL